MKGITTYGMIREPKMLQSLMTEFIIDIKAGSGHSLALNDEGQVFAWGDGQAGQLGLGHKNLSIIDP
jgi:alpha-tubulin suppressor-like RCC1 family protein